jgi:hypothetical protein
MSLRQSPELTPELLAARQSNVQHSTGPRTAAGKQNSKLNALKHGAYATVEKQTMLALGEDPEEFDYLKQDLMLTYGPGDPLWERQIDDLAKLYWRRRRLERAQDGLLRRAVLAVEEWQHRRRQQLAGATFDAAQPQAIDLEMTEPTDPGVRLRMLLSFLGVIRAQVQQRTFLPRQTSEIETLYRDKLGWRQARLLALLDLFNRSCGPQAQGQGADPKEALGDGLGPGESAGEPQYQELLRLLDEEIAYVQEEFEYEEKVNEEKAAIEREAALAPAGEGWNTLVRQQAALDRSIDRKVRILLALRKEFRSAELAALRMPQWGSGEGNGMDEVPDVNNMSFEPAAQELVNSSTSDAPDMDNMSSAALAEELVNSTTSEAPDMDNMSSAAPAEALLNSKLKERTENVYEDKGPASQAQAGSADPLSEVCGASTQSSQVSGG